MTNVVHLVVNNDKPSDTKYPVDAEVIDALERLLVLAKDGQVNGISVATMTLDKDGHTAITGSIYAGTVRASVCAAFGTIDVLKQRMLRDLMQWS